MPDSDHEIQQLLSEFSAWFTLPVQWGDQDAMRHVNNALYFRWFESARNAYANRLGMPNMMDEQGIGFIMAATSCNFRRQLSFPDTVHAGARVTRIGRTSLTMEYRVVSESLCAVAADGDSTLVMFDYAAQKPVLVSPELRRTIEQIEGRAFD
ncbi:MAG: acyl-CoA thioesterase [Planctomycetaceae bacterium]